MATLSQRKDIVMFIAHATEEVVYTSGFCRQNTPQDACQLKELYMVVLPAF